MIITVSKQRIWNINCCELRVTVLFMTTARGHTSDSSHCGVSELGEYSPDVSVVSL